MFKVFKKKKFTTTNFTKRQRKQALKKIDIILYLLKEDALKEMKNVNEVEFQNTSQYPAIEKLANLKHILIMEYDLSSDDLNLLNHTMSLL